MRYDIHIVCISNVLSFQGISNGMYLSVSYGHTVGMKGKREEKCLNYLHQFEQGYTDSLKTCSKLIHQDIKNKRVTGQEGSHVALTQNNQRLVLYPLLTSHKLKHASPFTSSPGLRTCPHPTLSFHSKTIVPSFSVILISPITNEPRIFFFPLLFSPRFLLFFSFL